MYALQIIEEMLSMLNHKRDTEKYKAMDQIIATYAPKSISDSITHFLQTRETVISGIYIAGYFGFYEQIFESLAL